MGDKDVRRLAEIEANLPNSPPTRLETHEHEVERERLLEMMCGKPARGGDRRSKDFQVGHSIQLENPSSFDARSEKTGRSDRSKRRSARLCKLLSAEERNRLKGTAVENCDTDLFAIAGMGNTKNREAVIDALSDPDNPASSLQEAQERTDLDRNKLERVKQKRAQSMRRDWMSADPETLCGTTHYWITAVLCGITWDDAGAMWEKCNTSGGLRALCGLERGETWGSFLTK